MDGKFTAADERHTEFVSAMEETFEALDVEKQELVRRVTDIEAIAVLADETNKEHATQIEAVKTDVVAKFAAAAESSRGARRRPTATYGAGGGGTTCSRLRDGRCRADKRRWTLG